MVPDLPGITLTALRTWRTVRHLTPEQLLGRLICRGRFLYMNKIPERAWRSVERDANRLPLPDPANPALGQIARHILLLQQAVHGRHLDGIGEGRFTLLGRTIDFGDIRAVEWRRELNEGNNALWRMNLSYFGYATALLAEGRERALEAVCSLVQSLERQNPFAMQGVFRDVWNPYSASHRLINLLAGLHLFVQDGASVRGGATHRIADAQAVLLRHVRFCAAFVRRNLELDLKYNHLLKNHTALIAYACSLGGLPAAWRFLNNAVPACAESQILDDGGHAERCPMYHVLSILDLMVLADAGVLGPIATQKINSLLVQMQRALAAMMHPDGDIALFNDSWLGEAPPARTLVTGGAEGAGDSGTLALEHSGYIQLRAGGNAAIFDCGACGPDDNPAHAHADFLAVELSVAGCRFLVDFGVPTYSAGALRDLARSASVHNGPRFKGIEPIEFWLSFRVGRRGRAHRLADLGDAPDTPLWCAGWQDGYSTIAATVARCLAMYPDRGVLIVDIWQGGAGHDAVVDFLVPGTWIPGDPKHFRHADGAAGKTIVFDAVAGSIDDPAPARYWPRFGEPRPAHRLRVHPTGGNDRRWAAVWIGRGDEVPGTGPAIRDALFDAVHALDGIRGQAA